jgi:transcriptional regulator with XRE-family HTH domain
MQANPQSLGMRIRRARERARLSQKELAQAVGASVRAVGDWENDRRAPRNRIGALEDVLEVSLTEDLPPPPVPRDIAESVQRSPGLTDEDRQRVMEAIARTLAGDPQPPPTEPAAAAPTATAAAREQRAG